MIRKALDQRSCVLGLLVFTGVIALCVDASAQEVDPRPEERQGRQATAPKNAAPKSQNATQEDDLLDDLLGLLDEPQELDDGKDKSPATVDVMGELREVQSGMEEIALAMAASEANVGQQQIAITRRLDKLIEKLREQAGNQSSGSNQNSSPDNSQAQQDRKSDQPGQPDSQQLQNGDSAKEPSDSDGTESADSESADSDRTNRPSGEMGDQPGDQNGDADGSVENQELDARDLQTGAWGNLPPQMRQRIQSSMVERFLPSYRDKIQAYYKAMMSLQNPP